jgi:hypothetical protein
MSLGTDTLFWKERKGAMPEIPASGDLMAFVLPQVGFKSMRRL